MVHTKNRDAIICIFVDTRYITTLQIRPINEDRLEIFLTTQFVLGCACCKRSRMDREFAKLEIYVTTEKHIKKLYIV